MRTILSDLPAIEAARDRQRLQAAAERIVLGLTNEITAYVMDNMTPHERTKLETLVRRAHGGQAGAHTCRCKDVGHKPGAMFRRTATGRIVTKECCANGDCAFICDC